MSVILYTIKSKINFHFHSVRECVCQWSILTTVRLSKILNLPVVLMKQWSLKLYALCVHQSSLSKINISHLRCPWSVKMKSHKINSSLLVSNSSIILSETSISCYSDYRFLPRSASFNNTMNFQRDKVVEDKTFSTKKFSKDVDFIFIKTKLK